MFSSGTSCAASSASFSLWIWSATVSYTHLGETLEERAVTVTADDMRAALPRFLGGIELIPPMYSAIKLNGQKRYDLARQGKEVARKPRRITIYDLALTEELGNGQYAAAERLPKIVAERADIRSLRAFHAQGVLPVSQLFRQRKVVAVSYTHLS